MGVELVLGSYGSGMASLSAILDLPVSSFKAGPYVPVADGK